VGTSHTTDPEVAADLPGTGSRFGYDGVDHPLWLADGALQSRSLYYYELDAIGNVRRLHGDLNNPFVRQRGELGGYSYTAFGKTIAVNAPGGVAPPPQTLQVDQPFQWQGKLLIAPGLYYSRARVWSTDLGAFLQPDERVFLTRGGTLWSWPGQNPFRWRDPSGRLAGSEWYWVTRPLGPYAAPLAADIAALSLFADQVNDLGAEIFAQQDANLNAIARAAARENEGKASRDPCKSDASGGGAKGPPSAAGDVAADEPGPRNPRHHIFPQEFRSEFESAGIDIDEHTIEMSPEEHQQLHSNGWNQEWGDFFDENPNPSPQQIRNFATELLNEYGLANRPIIPF
jgi:RHS repeat-associated protein